MMFCVKSCTNFNQYNKKTIDRVFERQLNYFYGENQDSLMVTLLADLNLFILLAEYIVWALLSNWYYCPCVRVHVSFVWNWQQPEEVHGSALYPCQEEESMSSESIVKKKNLCSRKIYLIRKYWSSPLSKRRIYVLRKYWAAPVKEKNLCPQKVPKYCQEEKSMFSKIF